MNEFNGDENSDHDFDENSEELRCCLSDDDSDDDYGVEGTQGHTCGLSALQKVPDAIISSMLQMWATSPNPQR